MSKLSGTLWLRSFNSFLIHRKYFHILNWNLPFLVALRTELPLWNWLNLSLSMIFRKGHVLSLFCQSLGVYLCHGMVYQPYSDHLPGQIHPEPRSHSLPGTNRLVLCSRAHHSLLRAAVSFSGPKNADWSRLTVTALGREQKLKAKTCWSTTRLCPWNE